MVQKIYVGNLPFSATDEDVRALFTPHGSVMSCALPTDRESGSPRGFGFVEMEAPDAAKAIAALNGQDFQGRTLTVNEARPRAEGRSGNGPSRW